MASGFSTSTWHPASSAVIDRLGVEVLGHVTMTASTASSGRSRRQLATTGTSDRPVASASVRPRSGDRVRIPASSTSCRPAKASIHFRAMKPAPITSTRMVDVSPGRAGPSHTPQPHDGWRYRSMPDNRGRPAVQLMPRRWRRARARGEWPRATAREATVSRSARCRGESGSPVGACPPRVRS